MINLAIMLSLLFVEMVFLRDLLSYGNLPGDSGDGRLINLTMEHWWHFLCGQESFDTLSMFYPFTNTVSYTDMLLSQGFIYSIFRFFGLDLFAANQLTAIVIHVLGAYALYFCLWWGIGLRRPAAYLGTTAFTFANSYYVIMNHVQMLVISMLPLVFLVFIAAWKFRHKDAVRRIWTGLGIAGTAMLAYSGWYTFYYFCIFCGILVLSFTVVCLIKNRELLTKLISFLRRRFAEIFLWVLFFVVLLVPFLIMYLPTARMSGGRDWGAVAYMLPQPFDIFNLGPNNFLFGFISERVGIAALRVKGEGELQVGFSPVLLLMLAVACLTYIKKTKSGKNSVETIAISSLMCAIAVSIVLVIEVNGLSIWWFIWRLVPGASSIRAMARWYVFLLLPMGILLAVLADRLSLDYQLKPALLFGVAAILLLSNYNTGDMSNWTAQSQKEFLSSISEPPDGAEVMALMDSSPSANPNFAYDQLDAWIIADSLGIQTINGYSGVSPNNFDLIADITADTYPDQAAQYVRSSGVVKPVYLVDRATGEWTLLEYAQ